VKGVDCD